MIQDSHTSGPKPTQITISYIGRQNVGRGAGCDVAASTDNVELPRISAGALPGSLGFDRLSPPPLAAADRRPSRMDPHGDRVVTAWNCGKHCSILCS